MTKSDNNGGDFFAPKEYELNGEHPAVKHISFMFEQADLKTEFISVARQGKNGGFLNCAIGDTEFKKWT